MYSVARGEDVGDAGLQRIAGDYVTPLGRHPCGFEAQRVYVARPARREHYGVHQGLSLPVRRVLAQEQPLRTIGDLLDTANSADTRLYLYAALLEARADDPGDELILPG